MLSEENGDGHYHPAINSVMYNRSLPARYTDADIIGVSNHLLTVF